MSSPPVGTRRRGLVLLTVGPPEVTAGWPGQVRQGPGGGWGAGKPQATSIACVLHHGPSANHRGSGWEAPAALAFPLVSACPIGDSLNLHLSVTFSCHVSLSVCSLLFLYLLSAFSLPFQLSPVFSPVLRPSFPRAFLFLVRSPLLAISSFPSPCHLLLICQILHVAKEKKRRKKNQNTKKPKQKQISSVLPSAASSWWPLCACLWPAACPPAPRPSAVCPARLPACPSSR